MTAYSVRLRDGKIAEVKPFFAGKLSPFWAQEYVGSDLAREFLSGCESKRTVRIGLMDYGDKRQFPPYLVTENALVVPHPDPLASNFHARWVGGLIIGEFPIGTSETGKFALLNFLLSSGQDKDSLSLVRAAKPEVINASISEVVRDWKITPLFHTKEFEPIARETILIKSSGNSFPQAITQVEGAIHLGSLSPLGFESGFSQSDEHLDILAPADLFTTTIGPITISDEKTHRSIGFEYVPSTFGRTSAASPIVTGAVANVLALIPGLSGAEVKILLRNTSIPLEGGRGPVGMLNAYKLVRVAERLARDPSFLGEGSEGRMKRLSDRALYDFRSVAERLFETLGEKPDVQTALKSLRRAFLLDPENGPVRQRLIENYRALKQPYHARFLESLSKEGLEESINTGLSEEDPNLKASALRALAKEGMEGKTRFEEAVDKVMQSEKLPVEPGLAQAIVGTARIYENESIPANAIGARGRKLLVQLLIKGSERYDLLQSFLQIPEEEKREIIESLLAIPSDTLRKEIVYDAVVRMRPVSPRTLELVAAAPTKREKTSVLDLLQELKDDENETLKFSNYRYLLETLGRDTSVSEDVFWGEKLKKMLESWPRQGTDVNRAIQCPFGLL